jgi:hypothetical protein
MSRASNYPSLAPSNVGELNRLLTAAVVNRGFCNLLLTNPASALAAGYNGESFRLAAEDRARILSIQAKSLTDFAMQLAGNLKASDRGRPGRENYKGRSL